MRISKVWTGFLWNFLRFLLHDCNVKILFQLFFAFESSSILLFSWITMENIMYKTILFLELFYFLRYCVQDYQKHERNIVINQFFSPQIFGMQISRCGQNFHRATITIFKHQLQTWIFKYIIFSNHYTKRIKRFYFSN